MTLEELTLWGIVGVSLVSAFFVVDRVIFGGRLEAFLPRQLSPGRHLALGVFVFFALLVLVSLSEIHLTLSLAPSPSGGGLHWGLDTTPAQLRKTGLTILLMTTGVAFYILRHFERRVYGLIELVVGWVAAYNSVSQLDRPAEVNTWLPVAASVYLVVRGIDNLMHGIEASRKKRAIGPLTASSSSVVTSLPIKASAPSAPEKPRHRGRKGKRRRTS
ncbi:hypothetical protein JY651_08065 [Pyxidicoccus parkwayensis]|uniref:Uncharacterized protein n=1 Tax=Pyxidicoccus parkwayensis TaxID=2813578 RepID=A0ABX7P362_9BACT|nr:hypothetical protein [Pyxidicoccus parkwaysis]QSQ24882.1 hypothetical protein JY651_08065 [Pyxidicoccus parkwaysis]